MAASPGYTKLHLAVIGNQLAPIRQLLLDQPEIDSNARTRLGETPLFLSLKNNCRDEIVLTLIDSGCDVNIPNNKGVTPLHLAVERENCAIILKLLEKGADVYAKDKQDGFTPLHRCVKLGRLQILREILDLFGEEYQQKIRDTNGITLLVFSLQKNCSDKIVNFLIDYGEDVNAYNYLGLTPLRLAVKRRRTNILYKLLQRGAEVNNSLNPEARSPLHDAAVDGNLENACMLLYHDASINEEDDFGRTPFDLAIIGKNYSLAMILIDYVADFNHFDTQGFTALHHAIQKCPEIAVEIIERGGNVNVPWHETHAAVCCIWWHESSEVFEAVWSRIDYEIFLQTINMKNFIETFVFDCKFPDDQFLKCLYMILESPYINDTFAYCTNDHKTKTLFTMIMIRDMLPTDRVNLIWILLSYGIKVYLKDVCYLYEKFGFENYVDLILLSGCYIHRSKISYINPMISKILYNNFKIYKYLPKHFVFSKAQHLKNYNRFYSIDFEWRNNLPIPEEEFLIQCKRGVKSLVQICRDVVRKVIFQTSRNSCSFKVYQAFHKLPVPSEVIDILCLKKAIY